MQYKKTGFDPNILLFVCCACCSMQKCLGQTCLFSWMDGRFFCGRVVRRILTAIKNVKLTKPSNMVCPGHDKMTGSITCPGPLKIDQVNLGVPLYVHMHSKKCPRGRRAKSTCRRPLFSSSLLPPERAPLQTPPERSVGGV